MKCRPRNSADIPEMTRIITEGFLDIHFISRAQAVCLPDGPLQCLAVLNEMMAKSLPGLRNTRSRR